MALVTEAPFNLRTFSYVSVPYTFTNVRRIGTTAQGEVDNTMAGDVVLAKAGTYPENVSVPRALTLKGAGIGSTVLQGTAGAGTGISLAGGLSNVTIGQLTAQGYNYGIQMPTGPLSNVTVQDVATINNAIRTYLVNGGSIPDSTRADEVLARLKCTSDQATSARMAGLRGTMLDARLRGISIATAGPERAVWNSAKQRFEIATTNMKLPVI